MVQSLAISKRITSIAEVEEKFNLALTENNQFFTEWFQDLPELNNEEKISLDKIQHRYSRHRRRGELAEGTVNLLLVSPLLELAGFYDEPFFIKTEPSVESLLEDEDELWRGRIDTLVFQEQLWILLVESKRTAAYSMAIPQALVYMMANPNPNKPVYGMVTNGDEFKFIKLLKQERSQYDLSDTFSLLFFRQNKLYDILRVLKQIRGIILQSE